MITDVAENPTYIKNDQPLVPYASHDASLSLSPLPAREMGVWLELNSNYYYRYNNYCVMITLIVIIIIFIIIPKVARTFFS